MILSLIACFALCAPQQGALVPVGLIKNGQFAEGDTAEWVSSASSFEILTVNQPGFKYAARATFTPKAGGNPWDIGLNLTSTKPILKGSPVKIHAWIRSANSSKVALIFEQNSQPFTKIALKEVDLTPQWKEYQAEGIAAQEYTAGSTQLTVYLGYNAGSIDIANVTAETLGIAESKDPVPLLAHERLSNGELSGWGPTALNEFKTVPAGSPKFEKAIHCEFTNRASENPWAISLHAPSSGPVKQGHTIYLRAWMRSASSSKVSLIFERASNPFNKPINQVINLVPEWKEYRVAGISDADYKPTETQLTVFLNYGTGSVEIGDVLADDIGLTPISSLPVTVAYYAKPPSEAWRAPALARIEKYRKGDFSVKVTDANGKPIKGAIVKVEQVRQEFRFGTAAPAQLIVAKTPVGERFRANLARFFNTVVFENDLKWHQIAPEDYSDVDAAIKWLADRNFRIRGHNLVWGTYQYLPKDLKAMSNDQIVETIHKRITDMVTRFKGKLYLWDVVNEAATERELWDRIGWDKFGQVYKWAREADPNVQLCYNDYDWTEEEAVGSNHRVASTNLVKLLLKQGAPLDAIGLQSHDGPPLTPMSRVIEITQGLAKFGKALEVTEYDLGVQDDKFNGQYMRDFLTAMYSVPQVQSFLMWGFWEGAHWRANEGGAMIRKNWKLRPAALVWEDLVKHQWSTNISLTTKSDGTVRARAFYGLLKVTVTAHGKAKSQQVAVLPGKSGDVRMKL